VSPNLCALAIYLELVITSKKGLEGLMNVNVRMMMFVFFHKLGVFGDGHYCWLKGPINPLPMGIIPCSHHLSTYRIFAIRMNISRLWSNRYIISIILSFIGFLNNI
jgi:hypothetical protein